MADSKQMTSDDVKALVTEVVTQQTALVAGLLKPVAMPAPVIVDKMTRCFECGQLVYACGSKHDELVVLPVNPRHHRWFRGITINGITYRSERANHRIKVPAGSSIAGDISTWERNEDETINGRVGQHTIGNANNPNTNTQGWR